MGVIFPKADQKTCSGCTYYQVSTADLSQGECCVNPPVPVPVPDGRGGVMSISMSPPVKGTRLACKEHQAK